MHIPADTFWWPCPVATVGMPFCSRHASTGAHTFSDNSTAVGGRPFRSQAREAVTYAQVNAYIHKGGPPQLNGHTGVSRSRWMCEWVVMRGPLPVVGRVQGRHEVKTAAVRDAAHLAKRGHDVVAFQRQVLQSRPLRAPHIRLVHSALPSMHSAISATAALPTSVLV